MENNLFEQFQSAYRPYHSMETALINPLGSEVILGGLEMFLHVLIFVLISATYNILLTNMYLFLYSAQTLLQ